MTVKNVGGATPNAGLGKVKGSEVANGAVIPELGNPASIAQSATNIGNSNKNYGVELSDRARSRSAEQKKAFDIAKKTPDIREDRVAALKAKIDGGVYEVDSGKIADGMLREAMMEHLATSKDS
jgi:negative regulator of flagellin synthesis FlgM